MLRNTIPMLFPDDLEKSRRFYTQVLGFVEAGGDEEFIELRSGTLTLWLHGVEAVDDSRYRQELKDHKRGVGLNLSFEVDDVDKYHERLVQEGRAPVEQPPTNTPWGTRKFTIQDPDGYHLSFFSYE